jgi:hypothetical protein
MIPISIIPILIFKNTHRGLEVEQIMIQNYKKDLPRPFQKPLQGGQEFEPPRLMSGIN